MHVDHEGHRKYGRGEIDDRDRYECSDHHASKKYIVGLAFAHGLRFVRRSKSHGGKLEIFPAEQVGVREEQNDNAEPANRMNGNAQR